MRIDILTVLPEMIEGFFDCSIMARAKKKGLADIVIHNIRDYTTDKHRRTDDYPFGGCAGMVMKIEPIDNLITKLKSERHYDEVIFTTPDGSTKNMLRQYYRNPRGFRYSRLIVLRVPQSLKRRIMLHVHYTAESFLAGLPVLKDSPEKLLTLLALPIGAALAAYIRLKNK